MEDTIKNIQKFINKSFTYQSFLAYIDKQKDFLLNLNILESIDGCEYNAMWDTLYYLEDNFKFAKDHNCIIGCSLSVLWIYNNNLKWRKSVQSKKTQQS